MKNEQDKGLLNQERRELSEEDLANVAGGVTPEEKLLFKFELWRRQADSEGYILRHKTRCHSCIQGTADYSSVYYLSTSNSDGSVICVDNKCFSCGLETKYLKWESGFPFRDYLL